MALAGLAGLVVVVVVVVVVTTGGSSSVPPRLGWEAGGGDDPGTGSTPYRNGQTIKYVGRTEQVLRPYSRIMILECADPGGTADAPSEQRHHL